MDKTYTLTQQERIKVAQAVNLCIEYMTKTGLATGTDEQFRARVIEKVQMFIDILDTCMSNYAAERDKHVTKADSVTTAGGVTEADIVANAKRIAEAAYNQPREPHQDANARK